MRNLDKKYADILIKEGINIQKGQTLVINADPIHHDFVVLLTQIAYENGAKEVIVDFNSEALLRQHLLHQDDETLETVPSWTIDKYEDLITRDLCKLALRAPNPGILDDVDSDKMKKRSQAQSTKLQKYSSYSMNNEGQWLVAAYPSLVWAQKVFPKLEPQDAYNKLYDYILYACKVDEETDAHTNWENHNARLVKQNEWLNKHNFKSLRFTNSKGTDIEVGLVKDHIWCGGKDVTQKGVPFNPNMPTEESFTTPDRMRVDGIIYNTLPLNSGKIIDDFWLKFKDGAVVNYDAKVGKDALKALLETDEGSIRLGEVALVPNSSPISKLNTLFYNTLFDENASCHVALGRAYPLIPNGETMSKEELLERNVNSSLIHTDFMFGSEDMKVVGIEENGNEIIVMENGEFVI